MFTVRSGSITLSGQRRRCFWPVLMTAAGLMGLTETAQATVGARPCDIYAHDGTPCVAAYSTTRALYGSYRGALYQVRRESDLGMRNIGLEGGGYADAHTQDRFCAHTWCVITVLFDQSPRHNDLRVEGPGGNGNQDVGVPAGKLRITVGGHEAYGMYFEGGMGYRDNRTRGVATGARPESMYMVTSGTHFNSRCCFDFGNVETNGQDNGPGHMDAIYFGSICELDWPGCYGQGPWVEADLEDGLFMSDQGASEDPAYRGSTSQFVTATLKNNGTSRFAIKYGNARSGSLNTIWAGPLPTAYRPMHKEGAVVLGTGGDDSNSDVGSFFEGVITSGYATGAIENRVQANIAAAGYRNVAPR
jgi:hypothetical protein